MKIHGHDLGGHSFTTIRGFEFQKGLAGGGVATNTAQNTAKMPPEFCYPTHKGRRKRGQKKA